MAEANGTRVDDDTLDAMLRLARETMPLAYVPYSGFRVGAAVLGGDGEARASVNIENASYPLSVCADGDLGTAECPRRRGRHRRPDAHAAVRRVPAGAVGVR